LFGFVECLAFGDIVKHPLLKAACPGGVTLAEVGIETFTVVACIAATAGAAAAAGSVCNARVYRFLAQRRDQDLARSFALTLEFLYRTGITSHWYNSRTQNR
jgi:hypothetical protein